MSNIVRFIVTGDLHYRGTNPRARTDDFQAALGAKLTEVFKLADEYSCEAIIIPGDITDSPGITLPVLGDLYRLLRHALCPIITIPGNHDMWGANAMTLPRTPYGFLAMAARCIDDISGISGEPSMFFPGPFGCVWVTGTCYSTMTDRGEGDYIPTQTDKNTFKVHIAHGMLLERTPGVDIGRYTLIDDVANHPDAPDVLICGHEHIGFGVIKRGRTTFINPGALCRLTAHPAEIERQVQVCLLTIEWVDDNEYQCDTELIPLQSARPGHEVLSREHLEEQASREELISSFMALLAEEGEGRFLDIQDIVEDIARREHIPQDVVDEALRRIGQAREVLGL